MAIEDLDNFDIEFVNFFSELPNMKQRDGVDEKRDYIDSINIDITDLHDSPDNSPSSGLSDKQVSQLAEDQFREASLNRAESFVNQDANLFSDNS